jgi:hypothetical protein
MRADLATIAIAAVFMFAGFGVLSGAKGISGGLWAALGATGLAYMTGLISVLMVGIIFLVAGVGVSVPVFIAIGVVVGVCGFAAGGRHGLEWRGSGLPRAGEPPAKRSRDWSLDAVWGWVRRRPIALIAGGAFLIVVVWGYRWAQVTPLSQWDAWSIWARKGTILYQYGTPKLEFFAAPQYAFMHPDYPLLLPLLESIWFRFVRSPDTTNLHVQFWLFYVASLGAAAHVASRFSPAKVWLPVLGFIAFVPSLTGQLMSMYADVPMGLLLMVGVLLLGVWLAERRPPYLILATLFLAATASTKNEGLTYAVTTLVAAFLCTPGSEAGRRRGSDLKTLALSAAGFAAIILPWRVWLAAHHISGDIPVGKGLDPAYVVGRANRINPTLTAIYQQITNQGQWVWLLPMGIGLTLACLFTRRVTRLGGFFALTGIGVFLMIVWAYVVGIEPLRWWLATSASRTVDGMMFVSAAAILTLTGRILSPRKRPTTVHREEEEQPAERDATPTVEVQLQHDLTARP